MLTVNGERVNVGCARSRDCYTALSLPTRFRAGPPRTVNPHTAHASCPLREIADRRDSPLTANWSHALAWAITAAQHASPSAGRMMRMRARWAVTSAHSSAGRHASRPRKGEVLAGGAYASNTICLEQDRGLAQDEVLVRNCGHCLKAAHQTLLMLAGVLALELLAHQFEELRARRLVVGHCAAWIARAPPLRAPSGRGRPAMSFGGLAWLAHRGHCTKGCAHTRECIVRLQRAIGWICKGGALLCSTCSVRERRA